MARTRWILISSLVTSILGIVSSQLVCDVKKTSTGVPCSIPFTYSGRMYASCTTAGAGSVYWCSTTPDYDKDKKSAICNCTNLQAKTSTTASPGGGGGPTPFSGPCTPRVFGGAPCASSYTYEGRIYRGCINANNKGVYWCSLTDSYDRDRRWGNCENTCIFADQSTTTTTTSVQPPTTPTTSVSTTTQNVPTTPTTQGASCIEKAKDGANCAGKFKYEGVEYTGCITNKSPFPWCSLTYSYGENTWRECATPLKCSVTPCREKTITGGDCAAHFKYGGVEYSGCTKKDSSRDAYWCALTYEFDSNKWQDCALPLKCQDKPVTPAPTATPAPTPAPTPYPYGDRRNDKGCIVYIENSAETCHFPFTYLNKTYTSCTRINNDKLWCSKTQIYINLWGVCGTEDCSADPQVPTPVPPTVNCQGGTIRVTRINVTTALATQLVPIRMEGCFGDNPLTGVFFEEPQYACSQKIGSSVQGVIECTTPGIIPKEKTKDLMQIYIRIGASQDIPTGQYFNFRATPDEAYINSVPDMTTIAGGQVRALMRGGNLLPGLNQAYPSVRMSVKIRNKIQLYYEQTCNPLSPEVLECRTPAIDEDEVKAKLVEIETRTKRDLENVNGQDALDRHRRETEEIKVNIPGRMDFIPGVLLGGSNKYLDFSKLFPGSSPVDVYKDPQIFTRQVSNEVPYRPFWPFKDDKIKIPGKYLTTMFTKSDYEVLLGGEQNKCLISELKNDYIVCKPGKVPTSSDGETITKPKVEVRILPLNANFRAMTLSYEETFFSYKTGFAAVVGGGAALVVILLIIAIIFCMRRSRRDHDDNLYEQHMDSGGSTPRGSTGMNGFKYNSHGPMYTSPRKGTRNSRHTSRSRDTSRSRPREPTPSSSRSTSRSVSRKSYSSEPDFAY